MITLYTPATGFPDLEAKIAYGLARVGIEAHGSETLCINPEGGFYRIEIEGDWETYKRSFILISKNVLSSSFIPLNTPGITRRSANTFIFKGKEENNLELYRNFSGLMSNNRKSEAVCRHRKKGVTNVSNVIGFASATSYHHERNYINVQKDTYGIHRPTNPKKICKTCALLSLLGTWYATFMFSIKDKQVFTVPIPNEKIKGDTLTRLFSLQHLIRKEWTDKDIPLYAIPLFLLSKIPSSVEILEGFDLFISVISRQQGYHVDGLFLVPLKTFFDYIAYSPYNMASIETMLNRNAFDSLLSLSSLLSSTNLTEALKFPRRYSKETSSDNFVNLLYPETANYLLREVAMIRPEIIENEAINSVARTLRYFIRERKYHYADDIRNARKDSRNFEEIIVKMLREAELRRVQEEEKKKTGKKYKFVNIPSEKEIKGLFRLANENFDEVKTALVILALSFPTKREEIEEIEEEVENA